MRKESNNMVISLMAVIALFSLLFVFSGCYISSGENREDALITMHLDNSFIMSNTSGPFRSGPGGDLSQYEYKILFSGSGGSRSFKVTGETSTTITIPAGFWNITIEAWYGGELYAIGYGSAEVKAGESSSVSIILEDITWSVIAGVIKQQGGTYGTVIITQGNATDNKHRDEITVTATPAANYSFVKWVSSDNINGAVESISASYTFDITSNATLYAVFDGDGINTPKNIVTAEDLNNVRSNLGWQYALMADIVLPASLNWTPIGIQTAGQQFTGTFDGNGKTISGLSITATSTHQGLFGYIATGGEVKNLALINVNIDTTGSNYVGGVAGYNFGTIQNCYVTGVVSSFTTAVTASQGVGGIAGYNGGTGSVKNCYTIVTATARSEVGGIVGANQSGGTVQECVALGQSVTVTASLATIGRVEGSYPSPAGLTNNYARGDMVAYVNGSINSTAFNAKTPNGKDGQDVSGGTGAGEYNNQSFWTGLGWDFSSVWQWDSTLQLPALRKP